MQHQNEQQPVSQYAQPPLNAGFSKTQVAQSTFTPQGSGRRSGSLIESSAAGGRSSEDIRSKLARYKKEREDFEIVRQQFRQKSNDLGGSGSGAGDKQGYSENTPVTNPNGGYQKYGGHGAENSGPTGSNIFMDG